MIIELFCFKLSSVADTTAFEEREKKNDFYFLDKEPTLKPGKSKTSPPAADTMNEPLSLSPWDQITTAVFNLLVWYHRQMVLWLQKHKKYRKKSGILAMQGSSLEMTQVNMYCQ